MADDLQTRTFKPTSKRIQEAKKQGDITRSNDLNTFIAIASGVAFFYFLSGYFLNFFTRLMQQAFTVDINSFNPTIIAHVLTLIIFKVITFLLPIAIMLLAMRFVGSSLLGGFNFTPALLAPMFSRINPASGIKRMFSVNSITEIIKSIFKFTLVLLISTSVIWHHANHLIALENTNLSSALSQSTSIIKLAVFWLLLSLALFAVIDIPYQLWQTMRRLRMSYHEVKEETAQTRRSRPKVNM